ncbi:ABC transporter permease [Cerasibacillus terrae]|uniref:ABC transporter permease n=1 Tax=Cerasibacillus terrae TaxID=2498845 RepID=A0A5C8NZX2_9BACI|nr:ABC transporter permease [Cerasibacillus terrae]TXL66536.1 ABC transporter permease [Cerasibacillus terrae]
MRNAMKVAKWEIKKNLKNKSYLIGLFITPIIILVFGIIGSLIGESAEEEALVNVMIQDELGVYEAIEEMAEVHDLGWTINRTDLSEDEAKKEIKDTEETAYLFINQKALDNGAIPVYMSEDLDEQFTMQLQAIEPPIKALQMESIGLSEEQLTKVASPIVFAEQSVSDKDDEKDKGENQAEKDPLERIIPGVFAGIILFSIVIAGMYIFQSASQEKKDKIAEIILSSITPNELMQGKIIGYFVLGILQAVVLLAFAVPMALWKTDIPVLEYIFVPETLILVLIAVLGYLLFAALFVGIGATMADVSTTGNFQGLVMMLPFLPFMFATPVFMDPTGIVAKVGTYFPFTTPGVLLMRLIAMEEWPWMEIGIAFVVLIVSILIMMKLAGKIFKVGILMYGKNATPKEIWKWLWA